MKHTTHSIHIPPLTDLPEFLGMYRSLLETHNIGGLDSFPFQATSGFSHPIDEENQKLTRQFLETSRIIKQLAQDKVDVRLHDIKVFPHMAQMILSYKEATDNEQAPPPA